MGGDAVRPDFRLSDAEREALVALRRDLHRHPEQGFEEHRTAGIVEARLRELGLSPERFGGTGVAALLDSGRSGRCVLLRADMDALPVQEANVHDWASTIPQRMHACGHDGHTAALLAAAACLVANREQLAGRVLFVFQPAEEIGQGARAMIADGLLERYPPDLAFGIHLWSGIPTGDVRIRPGPVMAAADGLQVKVTGRGGHGAMPHQTRDPIVAAAAMITELQRVVARTVDPWEGAVVTVGFIQGGDAHNVIPGELRFGGTLRAFAPDVRALVRAEVERVITGVAAAHDVTVDVQITPHVEPVVNHPDVSREVTAIATGIDGLSVLPTGSRLLASEDFGEFLARIPGVFAFVGAGNPACGATWPHHHPCFEIDEASLEIAARLHCEVALALAVDESRP